MDFGIIRKKIVIEQHIQNPPRGEGRGLQQFSFEEYIDSYTIIINESCIRTCIASLLFHLQILDSFTDLHYLKSYGIIVLFNNAICCRLTFTGTLHYGTVYLMSYIPTLC